MEPKPLILALALALLAAPGAAAAEPRQGWLGAALAESAAPAGTCPEEMALVEGRVCVDRWEASLVEVTADGATRPWSPFLSVGRRRHVRAVSLPGVIPQAYISGAEAAAACAAAGKRLCRLNEWMAACRGPERLTYPYGNEYERGACNVARQPHPLIEFYGRTRGIYTFVNMNNPGINQLPGSLARTGEFARCESGWGVFDMVGNVHEWIADRGGTFKGGFYVDKDSHGRGCHYTTTAHNYEYHDYSTGFRCCADPT